MKKFFNKKIMKLYIALICVFLVLTGTFIGFAIHNANAYKEEMAALESSSSGLDNATNLIAGLLGGLTGQDTSSLTKQEVEPSEKALSAKSNRTVFTILSIVSGVFFLASIGLTIGCAEYEKYLASDKFKAAQRRKNKYKNAVK